MASSASIHVDLHSTRGLTESEAQVFAAHERRRQRAQSAFTLVLLGLVVWFFGAAAMTHLRARVDDDDTFEDDTFDHAVDNNHAIDNLSGLDASDPNEPPPGTLGLSGLGLGAS